MAISSVHSVSFVVRTWLFMIIFYLASYAAGSCTSYGHSCWGAHGKRSGRNRDNYIVPSNTMNDMKGNAPSFTKEEWILSRLIGQPSTSNRNKERFDTFFKIKSLYPQQMDNSIPIIIEPDQFARVRNNKNEGNESAKRRNINEIQDIIEHIDDDRNRDPDKILLTSIDEGNRDDSGKLRSMELYKLLSNSNDDFD